MVNKWVNSKSMLRNLTCFLQWNEFRLDSGIYPPGHHSSYYSLIASVNFYKSANVFAKDRQSSWSLFFFPVISSPPLHPVKPPHHLCMKMMFRYLKKWRQLFKTLWKTFVLRHPNCQTLKGANEGWDWLRAWSETSTSSFIRTRTSRASSVLIARSASRQSNNIWTQSLIRPLAWRF